MTPFACRRCHTELAQTDGVFLYIGEWRDGLWYTILRLQGRVRLICACGAATTWRDGATIGVLYASPPIHRHNLDRERTPVLH